MSQIWKLKVKTRRQKPYDREKLKRPYQATLSGVSVYRASRMFNIPESTLRDRTRHNVDVDCQLGTNRLFTEEEERLLKDHVVYMSTIGYGYNITQLQQIVADYAKSLNKAVKSKGSLSQGWVYSFLKRWDDLKVVKPQKLSLNRAKCASEEAINNYFIELNHVLKEHNLIECPERIYNVDESGFSTEHRPPKIVCGTQIKPQSVVSEKSKNVTIIGSANAVGNHVPPFYIFPGKRWMPELPDDSAPGTSGDIKSRRESGFVNRGRFESYMMGHFSKYVGLTKNSDVKTIVLYDGHKAHLSLTLTNWAKEHNVVLFVLPPHSSHLTQPLDVGISGPMKMYYYNECKLYMHNNPGRYISRYEVAKLTAKPYAKAFSPKNICSAFKKAGIFPFCPDVIVSSETAPAKIYVAEHKPIHEVSEKNENDSPDVLTNEKSNLDLAVEFLDSKKITNVVKQRPKKKCVPPVKIVGNLLSEKNVENTKSIQIKSEKKQEHVKPKGKKLTFKQHPSPKPSTFGLNTKGSPINLEPERLDSSDEYEEDDIPCCVCKCTFPPQLRDYPGLVILKWAQCDKCGYWVHLTHCCGSVFIRRGVNFYCQHCQ